LVDTWLARPLNAELAGAEVNGHRVPTGHGPHQLDVFLGKVEDREAVVPEHGGWLREVPSPPDAGRATADVIARTTPGPAGERVREI
jgi:hypothetical protein